MKRIIVVFLLLVFIIPACKKNVTNTPAAALEGKWYAQKTENRFYANGTLKSFETQTYSRDSYLEFMSNGTVNSTGPSGITATYNYTFTTTTNTLITYITSTDPSVQQVTTLTSKQLILHQERLYTQADTTYDDVYDFFYER